MNYRYYYFLFALLSTSCLFSQNFTIDRGHTFINFSVNRFAAVDVQGRFNQFEGVIVYDSTTQMITSAEIIIDVNSIDSGHETRDEHLRGGFWLDAEKYPEITFRTTSIKKQGNDYVAIGDFTIHGTTNEIELLFQMTGPGLDPTKKTTLGISTQITINRQDYGVAFSRLMDNGKLFIGNEVSININALAEMEE